MFGEATLVLREEWPAGATTESFVDALVELAPAIAHDLAGGADELRSCAAPALAARLANVVATEPPSLHLLRSDVKFGTATRPFHIAAVRLYGPEGRFAGTASTRDPRSPRSGHLTARDW